MYEALNLKDWPFRVTPDKEFGSVWAGRKKTKEQLERMLRMMALAPRSSLRFLWANFGMGKTHTLYHIEHLCRTKFPQLIPIYAVLPKQAKGFLDIYRAIAGALPLDLLGERLVAVGSDYYGDLCLHPVFAENPDVANAILATLSRDSAKLIAARQWLTAQPGLTRSTLGQIGVTRTIRSPEDATGTLTVLTRLLTWNSKPPRKALVMIDEFQRIGELTPRLMREINVGLHTYFNANSTGLELVLSFSFGRQDNLRFMLSEELRSRAELQTISLDTLSQDEAIEFVQDLLSQFRLKEASDPLGPFSPEAAQETIRFIARSKALTPRRLMLYFNQVLQEWLLDHGPDGQVKAEDAIHYLSSPDLGGLDSDTSETQQ